MELSLQTRQEHLAKITKNPLDLLVIGGGITGAGITLDAITRGLGVALIEMNDFASGATSSSDKLLRGPLTTANRERRIISENAPHLTKSLKIITPIYSKGHYSRFKSLITLKTYDILSQTEKEQAFFTLNKKESLKREPLLRGTNLKGSTVATEFRTNDSRLTLEILKKAVEFGAYLANYTKVVKFLFDHQTNQVIGLRIKDQLTGQELPIYAKRIINATGIYSEELVKLATHQPAKITKKAYYHYFVLSNQKLPITNALSLSTSEASQELLAIPVENKIYLGPVITDSPAILPAQNQLIASLNDFLVSTTLTTEDFERSWFELVPQNTKKTNEFLPQITETKNGLVSVQINELYTYRLQAKKAVDQVLKSICQEYDRLFIKCRTKTLNVAGGDVGGASGFQRYQKEFIRIGVDKFQLPHKAAQLLVNRYGSNVIDLYAYLLNVPAHTNLSDLDYVMLRYALEKELCLQPIDFLKRRTDYFYFQKQHALTIANDVIDEMAKYYQWSSSYHQEMIKTTWLALI